MVFLTWCKASVALCGLWSALWNECSCRGITVLSELNSAQTAPFALKPLIYTCLEHFSGWNGGSSDEIWYVFFETCHIWKFPAQHVVFKQALFLMKTVYYDYYISRLRKIRVESNGTVQGYSLYDCTWLSVISWVCSKQGTDCTDTEMTNGFSRSVVKQHIDLFIALSVAGFDVHI